MKALVLALLLIPATLYGTPAHAAPTIACSTGAYKPTPYGTAQVRGVGDIDGCSQDYATVELTIWVKAGSALGAPVTHYCYNTYYCSWYKIKTKSDGYFCYRTVVDGAVKDFNGNWYNLPTATSGALCTS
jgi:hypothetical protein